MQFESVNLPVVDPFTSAKVVGPVESIQPVSGAESSGLDTSAGQHEPPLYVDLSAEATAALAESDESPALSEAERQEVRRLRSQERRLSMAQNAQRQLAGPYARSVSRSFRNGPDGVGYAVDGSISLDTTASSSPQENLKKAQTLRAAAMASGQPSASDMEAIARANQMEAKAQLEMARSAREEAIPVDEEGARSHAAATYESNT